MGPIIMPEEIVTPAANAEPAVEATDVEALKADVEKWKSLSRLNEGKAKATAKDLKAFEEWKASQLSESERAIEDARSATRAEVVAEFGAKIARTAFLAAAKDRVADPAKILARIDVAQFLDAEGDPDESAITEFLDGIAPVASQQSTATPGGLFQGSQGAQSGSALPLNGDPLLARVMGILGSGQ